MLLSTRPTPSVKVWLKNMDCKNLRNRILSEGTDHILSLLVRSRMCKKASKFCGHACRLDLRLGHDVSRVSWVTAVNSVVSLDARPSSLYWQIEPGVFLAYTASQPQDSDMTIHRSAWANQKFHHYKFSLKFSWKLFKIMLLSILYVSGSSKIKMLISFNVQFTMQKLLAFVNKENPTCTTWCN